MFTVITNSQSRLGLRILHSILAINTKLMLVDPLIVLHIYKADCWHIHLYFKQHTVGYMAQGVHWKLSEYSRLRYNSPGTYSHKNNQLNNQRKKTNLKNQPHNKKNHYNQNSLGGGWKSRGFYCVENTELNRHI